MPAGVTKPARLQTRAPGASLFGIYVAALAASLVGNLLLRMLADRSPLWARLALAAVAAGPLIVAGAFFWRLLRRDLDEMLQRIVLEGLTFAMVVYVPVAALYVNLRAADGWLPHVDSTDVLMVPALLVAIGIIVARRRHE